VNKVDIMNQNMKYLSTCEVTTRAERGYNLCQLYNVYQSFHLAPFRSCLVKGI